MRIAARGRFFRFYRFVKLYFIRKGHKTARIAPPAAVDCMANPAGSPPFPGRHKTGGQLPTGGKTGILLPGTLTKQCCGGRTAEPAAVPRQTIQESGVPGVQWPVRKVKPPENGGKLYRNSTRAATLCILILLYPVGVGKSRNCCKTGISPLHTARVWCMMLCTICKEYVCFG